MRSSIVLSALTSFALAAPHGPTGKLGDAKAVTNNPAGAMFTATMPPTAGVKGSVVVSSGPGGRGVVYNIKFSDIPTAGSPFMYHVHEKPVPTDGNCTGTGAHLDPYTRGESPPCDASDPDTCQVGDLSGKFGNITSAAGSSFSKTVTDAYSSLVKGDPAYVGDKSIVFHLTDKKRIGCANFTGMMKM